MKVRTAALALLLATACGGESTNDEPRAASGGTGATGGAGASGGSTGGSGATSGSEASGGSTGGSGAVGGTLPNPPDCDPDAVRPTCVPDCGSDEYDYAEAACSGGTWVCPAGSTPLTECPEHSCRRDEGLCCDPSIGVMNDMECDGGMRRACPAPLQSIESGDGCRPEGILDCATLDEKACGSVVEECHNPGRCTTFCNCELQPDGVTLAWACATLLCE